MSKLAKTFFYHYLSDEDQDAIKSIFEFISKQPKNLKNDLGSSIHEQVYNMLDIIHLIKPDLELVAGCCLYPFYNIGAISEIDIQDFLCPYTLKIIQGVIKLSALEKFVNVSNSKENNYCDFDQLRKMLLTMTDDIRIIVIKISEHINYFLQHKRNKHLCKELAKITNIIYAPLANRLGISELKWQLEDLSFRYLHSDDYKKIAKSLDKKRKERELYADDFMLTLESNLTSFNIDIISIKSRVKHIYSIFMKMRRKNKTIDEIYDQTAVRIIVSDVTKCYSVLSSIHSVYTSIDSEFDDYIACPKANGYQSIHTAVYGPEDKVVEIQIRTEDMHEFAEYGLASHWSYKELGSNQLVNKKRSWLNNLVAWQKDLALDKENSSNIFDEEVFVFTPNGDVKSLPIGSTVLDFAYSIHTQVGHKCKGAMINNKIVPLTTNLKNGNIIEILTANNTTPSRDWLDHNSGYIKTNRARSKVLHWFRDIDFENDAEEGRNIIDKELKRKRYIKDISSSILCDISPYKSYDSLCAALGRGEYSIASLERLININFPKSDSSEEQEDNFDINIFKKEFNFKASNTMSHIALCCQPTPKDRVVGFVTLGRGITIHNILCNNIKAMSPEEKKRIIPISWDDSAIKNYAVSFIISTSMISSTMKLVNKLIYKENLNIINLSSFNIHDDELSKIKLTLEISLDYDIKTLINKIKEVSTVVSVTQIEH